VGQMTFYACQSHIWAVYTCPLGLSEVVITRFNRRKEDQLMCWWEQLILRNVICDLLQYAIVHYFWRWLVFSPYTG